ncbi:MAG: putative lipid II flippase FtsW [Ruminococcaceae bacterium]|nr:putative lipid II flippase FtsW [Oscillospiraceae bacterium]
MRQDDNNKKSETGFGRSAPTTQDVKKPRSDALHTGKSNIPKRIKTRFSDDISLSEALGNENDLPKFIQRMPKPFRRIWQMMFGGIDKNIKMVIPRESAGIDRVMLIIICILICIGSVMVFSASYAFAETRYHDSMHFLKKQIMFVIIGFIAMFITSIFTPDFYKMISRGVYAVSLLLLVAVLVMGFAGNGAQRWLSIGPISFQPSEIAKMSLVLILAWYFSVFGDKVIDHSNRKTSFFYGIFYPFSLIGITAVLVMLEKHLSCLIILGCIGLIMMFIAGSDGKLLGLICGGGIVAVGSLAVALEYTRRRLVIWLNPEKYPLDGGWQTLEGMLAIGSGGIFGLGLGNSRMKYSYVSEPANDFIFTITCEELGFVGAVIIIALFAIFIWRGYVIALKNQDVFARLTAFGITTQVAVQVLLNIAVVTNTIPNTGIALPFFSYGGTSLVILFAEMGILLSVSRTSHLKYR